jgi:hypothetical protein
VVGGFATAATGRVLDSRGRAVFSFDGMDAPGYFRIAVPEGQDGAFWQFNHCTGSRLLLTTPPSLAPTPEDLLLPREVITADAAGR